MSGPQDQPSRVGEVKYTTQAPRQRGSKAVAAPVRTLLVMPASAMTPARVSAVAGRLGVPVRAVQELVDAGRAIPIRAGLRGPAVQAAMSEESAEVTPSGMPGFALPVLGTGGLVAGGGLVLLAAVMGVFNALIAAAVVLTGGAVLLASLVPFVLWALRLLAWRRVASSWRLLEEAGRRAQAHELVGEARGRASAIRVHLAESELPELAQADIRSGLKDIEEDLDTLARSWDQLPQGTPSDEARTAMQARVREVERGLADLRATLSRSSTAVTEDAGGALKSTIAAARLAVDGLRR